MNKKKIIAGVLAAVVLIAGVVIAVVNSDHEHSFGDWQTLTPADCENAEVQVRTCECGEEETREGEPAAGHSFVSISAKCLLETPMETMVVTAEDLSVTGLCQCGAEVAITDGVTVEGEPLILGENTITVRYGELTTTLTIQAEKLNMTLAGIVSDDTYVSSAYKDNEYTGKRVLGARYDQFRTYIRVNVSDILADPLFEANRENAKVRLILTVTNGSVADTTVFTLKAFTPAAGVTDADFTKLTWNSVSNKEDAAGEYSQLHWSNGKTLANTVAVEDDRVTLTLAFSQIADFVDENGNILFAFGTNHETLKVASLESRNEDRRPVFQVVLSDEHVHAFDREVAEEQYLCSVNCKEKAKYYHSCECGAAGTTTFEYGEVVDHTYSARVAKVERTCVTDGMRAHYRCTECGKYFVEKDGQKVAVSADSLKIAAGHNCGKLIEQKDAGCTTDGLKAHYRCERCKKYFVEVSGRRVETTKAALKIPATGHTYSDLVPRQEATCEKDGMKAHYRCTDCGKYFVEKDGKKVAISADALKITADHDYKLIPAKAATCTQDGNYKYYKCGSCGKYFDADKHETTKEAQKIPAGHTFSDLVPRKEATCTEDGMKAHYRCTVCQKYFVEKDGRKVAINVESLKISAGHDMVMKFDEAHHWNECSRCGVETAHEDHCGGTATETERAKCEVCGQPYGEPLSGPAAYPAQKKRRVIR